MLVVVCLVAYLLIGSLWLRFLNSFAERVDPGSGFNGADDLDGFGFLVFILIIGLWPLVAFGFLVYGLRKLFEVYINWLLKPKERRQERRKVRHAERSLRRIERDLES